MNINWLAVLLLLSWVPAFAAMYLVMRRRHR